MASAEFPMVLDVGSSTTRAGFATPTVLFPNIISHVNGNTVVGNDAKFGDGIKRRVMYPFYGRDWDNVESIWLHAFKELKTEPEDRSIVLNYPYYPCTVHNKEKIAQIMFEKFNISALHLNDQSVLALYSSGRLSGLVVDSGFTEIQCYPIYEGHIMHRAMSRGSLVGGQHLTYSLCDTLKKQGFDCNFEVGNEIKEKLLYITQDPQKEMYKNESFTLPDGQIVTLGKERYLIPEEIFTSFKELSVIQDHVENVEFRCDRALRKDLLMNIVVSGGTALLPGFAERLESEVKNSYRDVINENDVKVIAPENRAISTWVGGTILSSLSTFPDMCMTSEDYDENGPKCVNTKFF